MSTNKTDHERSSNENERQSRIKNASKQADSNPCVKEQAMSYKCLDDNGYDRDRCSKYFQNYKNCREFWHYVMLDRKKKGIVPPLPPVAEREQVKIEYKHIMPW